MELNGGVGFVGIRNGGLMAAWTIEFGPGGVTRWFNVLNPAKLSHLTVPPGALLVNGAARFQLTPADGMTPTRRIRLRVTKIPATDFIVDAEIGDATWGAHARKFYRFGRQEPALSDPGPAFAPSPP